MVNTKSLSTYLGTRIVGVLIFFNIVSLMVILPAYESKLRRMVELQGMNFTDTTIAANSESLYREDFGTIVDNTINILQKTEDIKFVVVTPYEKNWRLVIKSDTWVMEDITPIAQPTNSRNKLTYNSNRNAADKYFTYTHQIDLGELNWGILSVGLSDRHYRQLITDYYTNAALTSLVLTLITFAGMLYAMRKPRSQIKALKRVLGQLKAGNLSARNDTARAIGEIHDISTAINDMADHLEEATREVQLLAKITEETGDALILFNSKLHATYTNHAFLTITQIDPDNIINLPLDQICKLIGIPCDNLDSFCQHISATPTTPWNKDIMLEASGPRGPDTHINLRFNHFVSMAYNEDWYFVVISDISARKSLEQKLNNLAYFDKLTGLANRPMFYRGLQSAKHRADRTGTGFVVMFLDLDDFKNINDSLGHDHGDGVLVEVARRLEHIFRGEDLVCRLGGDEFTVIMQNSEHPDQIASRAQSIIDQLTKPANILGKELRVGISIGITNYPDDADSIDELVKKADVAMYHAKQKGKNQYKFYTKSWDLQQQLCYFAKESLHKAINSGYDQFVIHYQPIFDIQTSEISEMEAQIRWNHPERGLLYPADFIPIAEQSEAIQWIGEWILKKVCKQAAQWDDKGFMGYISLKLSPLLFALPNFCDKAVEILQQTRLKNVIVKLRLAGDSQVWNTVENLTRLQRLNEAGFALAIDDFGTGHSSLNDLIRIPIVSAKIDRSLIKSVAVDPKFEVIVSSIISICHQLEISPIAEGVDSQEQADWLKKNDCDFCQGSYYKPFVESQLVENQ